MVDDVIETIFSYLPIKKLFALAILSKRYKYSWRFCRDLSFDKKFSRYLSRDEFKNILTNIFQFDLNPDASRFCLYFDATGETNLVFGWIQKAICLGIKELELDFSQSKTKFVIHHDLINVESIQSMKLVNCEIHDFPVDSNVLSNLSEVTFQSVRANPIVFQSIFTNCLALRTVQLIHCASINDLDVVAQNLKWFTILVVKDCNHVESITINAPTLSSFRYHGKICEINFQGDCSMMNDLILDIAHPRGFQSIPHIKEVALGFAFVETLTITSIFLEGLGVRIEGNECKGIEFFLWKLKEFHLVVTAGSYINPSDIAIFLKNCPYVERVFIDLAQNAFGHSLYWDFQGRNYLIQCGTICPFLKCVKLKGFTMKDPHVMMARFFLKNAIHLQRLILVKAKSGCSEFLTIECLRWEISSNANIEIYEYRKDTSTITPKHLMKF